MTKSKLSTKLIVETERTIVFRSRSSSQFAWCTGCGAWVEMALVTEAAQAAKLSELAIYQLVEARTIHFAEDYDHRVLICLNSLLIQIEHATRGAHRRTVGRD